MTADGPVTLNLVRRDGCGGATAFAVAPSEVVIAASSCSVTGTSFSKPSSACTADSMIFTVSPSDAVRSLFNDEDKQGTGGGAFCVDERAMLTDLRGVALRASTVSLVVLASCESLHPSMTSLDTERIAFVATSSSSHVQSSCFPSWLSHLLEELNVLFGK